MRKIWGLMLPSVLASGVTQFTIFINTGFALDLQKGSVTALTTAFRLWQLPVVSSAWRRAWWSSPRFPA